MKRNINKPHVRMFMRRMDIGALFDLGSVPHGMRVGSTKLKITSLLLGAYSALTGSVASAYTVSVTRVSQFTGVELEPTAQANMPTFPEIHNVDNCSLQSVTNTDLGASYSVTLGGTKHMRFLFGDTFGGSRRSAIVGTTTDIDASDGIRNLAFIYDYSSDTVEAKQVLPGPVEDASDAWYPIAGWAAGGYEWIWATKYDLGAQTTTDRGIFYSQDQWQTVRQASAWMLPGYYKNLNFDFVSVSKLTDSSGVEWITFAGLPEKRSGDVQVMKIRSSDMFNWLWALRFPDIWTGSETGWRPLDAYAASAQPIVNNVGEGSVMWVAALNRWMSINMDRDFLQIDARFSDTADPTGSWGAPVRVIDSNGANACGTDMNMITNVRYRNAYAPILLPDYTSENTVYFLFSRMSPGAGAGLPNCYDDTYRCSASGVAGDWYFGPLWPWYPCNLVYNTFLMRLTVNGSSN